MHSEWIVPDWPAPSQVHALITTRAGGVSVGPYASMNPADHVGDEIESVVRNRDLLRVALPNTPHWLKQVHSARVHSIEGTAQGVPEADASVTRLPNEVCVVLTADCLPVLFCAADGAEVGVAHAGWRGLESGILEHTVHAMRTPGEQLLAYLGPAIGPAAFEVGAEVREAFMRTDPQAAQAFQTTHIPGKYLADIYQLARQRLARVGLTQVFGGGLCTYADAQRFYSYRRDGATGRMASLIWRSA